MKISVIPENLIEWIALKQGLAPTPCLETQGSMILARSIIAATRLGVFKSIGFEQLTLKDIADRCQAHPAALEALLGVLASSGYLQQTGEYYALTPVTRKWLSPDNPISLEDFVSFRVVAWEWLTHLEDFVRTGKAVEMHQSMSAEQWQPYHRAMQSLARIAAPEVAKRTPVPGNAKNMLDIGGSHGYFSVTLCRRHPQLQSTILELPESIEYASPLLERENMGNRVRYEAGNTITDDLGENTYDLIFTSNLIHHFDEATNKDLFRRIAKALRPGGYFVVQKLMFPDRDRGQGGSFLNLFFALTSAAGNWSFKTIEQWQREADLIPQKTIRFRTTPATGQQVAIKP